MNFRVRTGVCLIVFGAALSACGAAGDGAADPDLLEEVSSGSEGLAKPQGTNGDRDYCLNPADPCVSGEGDCDAHSECTTNYCGRDNGPKFGHAAGSDVCVPTHCANKVLDGNETQIDCGGSCGSTCAAPVCNLPNGSAGKCTSDCPCAAGEGDCNSDVGCQSGICRHDIGPTFGFAVGSDVCVSASCGNGVRDGGELDVDCGGTCGPCAPPPVYFTEYTEGTSLTRGVEIWNATNRSISCVVRTYLNGATVPSGVTATLTVPPRSPYVVCHPSSAAGLLATCDIRSNLLYFGGDDAVDLFCAGVTVDVIGQIGVDPGSQWGTLLQSTADNTLRRRCGFTGDRDGTNAFVPAQQWDGFANNTFDNFNIAPVCP